MGRAKDWEIEQEERGWRSVSGKYVCPECFDDESLKEVVRKNVQTTSCDYCNLTGEDLTGEEGALIAAPFDSVMKIIAEGLQSEWNDADNEGIAYESAEGGYQAETTSSYELVWDIVRPNNEALARAIIGSLPDHVWVERHYYSLTQDQALWYGWENFCKLVKHENRYMFHLRGRGRCPEPANAPSSESADGGAHGLTAPAQAIERLETGDVSDPISGEDVSANNSSRLFADEVMRSSDFAEALAEAQEGVSASRMLDEIGEAVQEIGLIKSLSSGTKLFRGRLGLGRKPYRTARRLGSPPSNKTTASRMSPAGIPMFYGALDEYTAFAETIFGKLKRGGVINIGAFVTLEEFRVLDLTNLRPVPSIFSQERHLRPVLKFLHAFVRDLSKPIKKDGRVHIEYVPTQIVTEYFRHSFQPYDQLPVRGILYPSSRAKGRTACVLFFTREECGASRQGPFGDRHKQWLGFVRGSAETFNRKPQKPRA